MRVPDAVPAARSARMSPICKMSPTGRMVYDPNGGGRLDRLVSTSNTAVWMDPMDGLVRGVESDPRGAPARHRRGTGVRRESGDLREEWLWDWCC